MRARSLASVVAALVLLAFAPAAAQVVLDPPDWNIGRMEMDRPVTRTLRVRNDGAQAMVVTFVTTCGCLEASPSRVSLAPGTAASVDMSYAPEEPGRISVYFVVSAAPAGGGGGSTSLYQVRGMADPPSIPRAAAPAEDQRPAPAAPPAAATELRLYYSPGCRSCERLIARLEAGLATLPPGTAALVRRNVLEPEAFEELVAVAGRQAQGGVPALPALVVGDRVLAGEQAIEAGFEDAIAGAGPPAGGPEAGPAAAPAAGPVTRR